MHMFARVCMHMFAHVCMHMFARVCMHMFARVCMHMFARVCMHMFARVCMHMLHLPRRIHRSPSQHRPPCHGPAARPTPGRTLARAMASGWGRGWRRPTPHHQSWVALPQGSRWYDGGGAADPEVADLRRRIRAAKGTGGVLVEPTVERPPQKPAPGSLAARRPDRVLPAAQWRCAEERDAALAPRAAPPAAPTAFERAWASLWAAPPPPRSSPAKEPGDRASQRGGADGSVHSVSPSLRFGDMLKKARHLAQEADDYT